MSIWFWFSVIGEIAILPLYVLSLEHQKLSDKFGDTKGKILGDILGIVSGWGFFVFLIGIWVTPQPRFTIPFPLEFSFTIPVIELEIPLIHMATSLPLILVVLLIALTGVSEMGLKVAETHRAAEIIDSGIYSHIRHPQYVGAFLAHLALSILFSSFYSLLITPFIGGYLYFLVWKEEKELLKEFGSTYEAYQSRVPKFFPITRKRKI
ncbi:MAG: methyltransferase family protein [Candidatus Thorarchaeota archaeon]